GAHKASWPLLAEGIPRSESKFRRPNHLRPPSTIGIRVAALRRSLATRYSTSVGSLTPYSMRLISKSRWPPNERSYSRDTTAGIGHRREGGGAQSALGKRVKQGSRRTIR